MDRSNEEESGEEEIDTFPYANAEELEEGDKYYERAITKLPEPKEGISRKKVLVDLLNKFRKTPQFYRVSMPMVFIAPLSLMEKLSHYFCPTPSLLSISTCKTPVERMLRVVKWALANITRSVHKDGIAHNKPYNPIIGELGIWTWNHADSTTFCLSEQVSHHPPVSSFYISNRKKNISVRSTVVPRSKLYPNSFEMNMSGEINFRINNLDEEYDLDFPPVLYYGVVFGKMYSEHNGVYTITCKKTDLTFLMLFKEKEDGKVMGRVIHRRGEEDEKTLYKFGGKAYQKILIKNMKMKKPKVSLFVNNSNNEFVKDNPPIFKPLKDQLPNEMRRNWHMVTKHLIDGNHSEAHKYKDGVENVQRAKRKIRNEEKEEWKPKYFEVFKDTDDKITLFKSIHENRGPFVEGEEDAFENHELFQSFNRV